jgi:two-component system, NtrC family, sensor histidine kinase HydH
MAPPAEDLMDLVAIGVAHEVRNPLNAVQLNLRILGDELRGLSLDPSLGVFAALARISSEVGHIDRFVTDFLRYARPIRLARETVPIRSLVVDLAASLSTQAARSGVGIEVTGKTDAVVEADGVHLRQALVNVAMNAVDVSPRHSHVTIELADQGSAVAIDIYDAGPRLTADTRNRVFEPFSVWRDGVTGLAMPIARRIVEAHGGTLVMESVPDRGNCARMRLPAQRRG